MRIRKGRQPTSEPDRETGSGAGRPPDAEAVRSSDVRVANGGSRPAPSTEARARVLLADDDPNMRRYIRQLLKPRYEVQAVADGAAALAAVRELRPDLVLADIMMPELDGIALLRALRADPDLRTVPVILVSARSEEETRVEGLEQGADDYIVKPFSARELQARIGALLERARIRQERLDAIERLLDENREQRELLQKLFDHAMDAVLLTDPAGPGKVLAVNPAACRMFGYSETEFLDLDRAAMLSPDERNVDALQQRREAAGQAASVLQYRRKDGSTFPGELSTALFTNSRGQKNAVTIIRDITGRKQRERRIDRYNRVLRGINRIFEQAVWAETEGALGSVCLAVALEVTGSQIGFVGEIGADGLLHDIAISDMGWEQCRMADQSGHHRPPGNFALRGLYGWVLSEGRSLLANDPPAHADSVGLPPGHPALTCFLGVPLIYEGRTVGMVAAANREGGYNPEQQEDLEALAPAIVEALYRRRAELGQRGANERYELVLAGTEAGIWDWDVPRKKVVFSPQWKAMRGFAEHEVGDDEQEWSQGIHPADAPRVMAAIQAHFEDRTPFFAEEYRVRRKDGSWMWIADRGVARRDENGHVVRMAGSEVDITERKLAEEALHRYAGRLRFLHEVDEAILVAHSAVEVAQAVVQRAPRLLPCQRASVVLYDPQTREVSLLAAYNGRGHGGPGQVWQGAADVPWNLVLERLTQGQEYVVEDVQALPASSPLVALLQEEGVRALVYEPIVIHDRFVGALKLGLDAPGPLPAEQREIVRDLAVQLTIGLEQARLYEAVQRYAGELELLVQQRTAALEASEARLRTIFEEAAIGIALTDREGRLVATNPALRRMLGYSEQELSGVRLFDLLTDGNGDGGELPTEVLAGRYDDYAREQRYVRKDGARGEANVTVSLLRGETVESSLVLALVEDITERKQAQEALVQTERLAIMGRMAASLAHEVNNPIQSVVGCLGLAMEVLAEGEDAGMYMTVAMDELERAARIVHRMRDLGRQEEGHKEPGSVGELVDKVLILTQKQAQNARVQVSWEGGADLPPLPMVRDRIQQVFLNLILNAIDAMPHGGALRIGAVRTEGPPGVAVSFADTGVGIAPEEVERLFGAFHSTKQLGLGLGLYVSHGIVQGHGGWIDVHSEVGVGTTFTVWLPGE